MKINELTVGAFNSPTLRLAIDFLRHASSREVYTVRELTEKLHVSVTTLKLYSPAPEMQPFRIRLGRQYLYGSATAISRVRKRIEG